MILPDFLTMKKTIFTIFSIFIWFLGFTFADLEITNYKVLWDIQSDWTINVEENIDVNFFSEMHGIERKFTNYYTSQDIEFQTYVDNILVPDYNYKILDNYDWQTVRIWDVDVYVSGEKSYEIDYDIYGLIRNFSGMWYAELYWNVIWYEWSNDINNVQIELTLPKAYPEMTQDDFMISAGYWDGYSIDDFDGSVTRDENKIYITYNHKLNSYNWITLAIKFPNWYFDFDHDKQESLLVWYVDDYNIENYKINWTIDRSGNIAFQNEIELEILNEDPRVRWELPYHYWWDWNNNLIMLNDISVNWVEIECKENEYDTTTDSKSVNITWDFSKDNKISANYSIYGLIRPFSGEFNEWTYSLFATTGGFDEWTYRLYLQLPLLNLNWKIKNLELTLDMPSGSDKIYMEDVYVNLWDWFISMKEFNEKYGHISYSDNKLALTYSWEISKYSSMTISINFVKWTFDLDENLLEALGAVWDGQFYYSDKTNRQSILFAIFFVLCGRFFKRLMNVRYLIKSRMNRKCVIQYDAPKWVDAPEAGVLIDEKIDGKDLTSLIYMRAIKHYIKIFAEEENPKKFYIKKLKDLPENSKKYQLNLFNSLFKSGDEFHFDEHPGTFTDYLRTASDELESYIDSQGWYKWWFSNMIWAFFKKQTASIIILVVVWLLIAYFSIVTILSNHLIFVSNWVKFLFAAVLIFIIFCYRNYEQEVNTKKWQEVRDHCVWYKDFLVKVDKTKLETLMKQDPLYLEKVLPYAVVFGIYSQFIKKITPELLEEMDWFDGDLESLNNSIRYMNNQTNGVSSPVYSSWSYSSSWWFSWGSSFGGWFSSGWGGGWGWGGWR